MANLSTLSEYCLPFVKVGGSFISYKSAEAETEVKEAQGAFKVLGGRVEDFIVFTLPGSDMRRMLVEIKKEKKLSGKYPRKAGLPGREPLK